MKRIFALVVALFGVGCVVAIGAPQSSGAAIPLVAQSWPSAGHDASNDRDNPAENVLAPGNVSALKQTWSKTFGGTLAATPAVVDGVVYIGDASGELSALSAATGATIWQQPVSTYTGYVGDVARATPVIDSGILIDGDHHTSTVPGAQIFAARTSDGAKLWSTVVDPQPAGMITGAPTVSNGVIYVGVSSNQQEATDCCTWRGSVVALDEKTGKILWRTMTAPPGYTGNAVWASAPAVDTAAGLVYIGTGNNYSAPPGVCLTPNQTGCTAPEADDYTDSLLALRIKDGSVAWSVRTLDSDVISTVCVASFNICGPDYDLGAGPNLFSAKENSQTRELVGVGQKSGVYWAVDALTGKVVWHTQVGPGGTNGGIEWGGATDGTRIYVAEGDFLHLPYLLASGWPTIAGSFAALDPATGRILWQTADPGGNRDFGFVSVANGVVYGGSDAVSGDDMFALDAATGAVKWSYAAGGSVMGGAAVVDGRVYWASGYYTKSCPIWPFSCAFTNVLHAFALPSLPNLTVTSVTASPAHPAAGQAVRFTATVRNAGAVATPANTLLGVGFAVDGTEVSWSASDLTSLAAGASVTLTADGGPLLSPTWKATAGTHTLTATVDDASRIPESNEADNTLSASLPVG